MAPSPAKSNRASATKKVVGENRPTQHKLAATADSRTKASKPVSKAPAKATAKPASKSVAKVPVTVAAKPASTVPAKQPAAKASASKVVASKASVSKSVPAVEVKASRLTRSKATTKVPAVAPLAQRKAKPTRPVKTGQAKSALLSGELPGEYGLDRLVAIPKDPEWTHLYWEVSPETRQSMPTSEGMLRLRGFDTTGLYFDGTNAPVALDIEVAPFARSWYAKLPYQGRVYTFEYGWITPQGEWRGVARSQPVGFEPGMAQVGSQEEWISIASEELFRAAAGLGDGEGI
ncbi:MAG TPA: DUF4912 domain-containing protein, partial [Fibrobacteria bacterium]|nr:DUF4912 domain-containing protein [Fibrobacteria bacterium]